MAETTEKQDVQMQAWLNRIRERKNSGLTIKEWCAQNGLPESRYYYWLKKARKAAYSEAQAAARSAISERNDFVELPAPSGAGSTFPAAGGGMAGLAMTVGGPALACAGLQGVASIKKGTVSVDLYVGIPAPMLRQILEVLCNA